jgi:hypothetical protein
LKRGVPVSKAVAQLNSFFGAVLGYLCIEFAPRLDESRATSELNALMKPYPHLHANRNVIRGVLIGVRDGTTPMSKSGFDHLVKALLDSMLSPLPSKPSLPAKSKRT